MSITLTIPGADFGYVLLAAGAIGFVQLGLGSGAMGFRKNFKSKDFLNKPEVKALQEQHKKEFGSEINDHGYPDMGNGRYSQLLSYGQWVSFNNAQRGHYSMVESSAPVLATLLLNGFFQPKYAGALGFAYALGRLLFALGYQTSAGANGRLVGAGVSGLGQFGLYGLVFYNAYNLLK